MKKRVFSVLIVIVIVLSIFPTYSLAETKNSSTTSYRTNYNPDNYFEFSVNGDYLTISGKYSDKRYKFLWIKLGSLDQGVSSIDSKGNFEKTFSINSFKAEGSVIINVLLGKENIGWYSGIYYGSDVKLKYSNSAWSFDYNQDILKNNINVQSKWTNPGGMLNPKNYDQDVTDLSNKITEGAKSDYEKVFLIHNWVADNIYYDVDYWDHKIGTVTTDPAVIIKTKRAICTGYSSLTRALCVSQNIPCIVIGGYDLNSSANGVWPDEALNSDKTNHEWNEAWVDGRWITLDTTWDSANTYENGTFNYKGAKYPKYFDISNEQLARNHKVVRRGKTGINNIPSDWAQPEILKSFSAYLIPYSLQNSYANNIKRSEFCSLITRLFELKSQKSIDKVLSEKGLIINSSTFTDTNDINVLSAYALGIVGGKGGGIFDPNGAITRQEAAVMLTRAAKVLGIQANSDAISFNDSATFESWGASSISFISSVLDKTNGRHVMGGTENGNFSPNAPYTREQSYCTVLRLYNAA